MKKLTIIIALLILASLGAASKDVLPYVTITNPLNEENVFGETTIKFRAEGQDLTNPILSIYGNTQGIEFPVKNCIISSQPEGNEGTQTMSCSYDWDPDSFEGQKVKITATVKSTEKMINDNVTVYVSGERV